jgi:hypothetical protein
VLAASFVAFLLYFAAFLPSNTFFIMTKMIISALGALFVASTSALSPPHYPSKVSSSSSATTSTTTQQNAVAEFATAIQEQSNNMMLYEHASVVVGPFSDILEGHHPAQFDNDGGIMMTERIDDPVLLKHGMGASFVPPSPMKEANEAAAAATAAAMAKGWIVPTAVIFQEKSLGRPVPVYYMD